MLACLALLVVAAGTGTGVAPAAASAAEVDTGRRTADRTTMRVAERAGLSVRDAETAIASETSRVQADGTVVIIDDGGGYEATEVGAERASGGAARRDSGPTGRGPDVSALHSNPGAAQTIYLDVDGADLRGTVWTTGIRHLPDGEYAGFSLDGDPALSAFERQLVEQTWRETAAYFAAFDVDVTTEQPARGRIERSSENDREFGVWVVISTDEEVETGTCGVCGGVAILGQYDVPDGRQWLRPAFSFAMDASIVAHEVGHTLGLLHDGKTHPDGTVDEYYSGHGAWSPIMGANGNPHDVTQWSAGDYPGATNTQDDYTVMLEHGAVWRADGAGDSPASSASLAAGTVVESLGRDDVDVFALPACAGRLSVLAEVPDGAGLDVSLDLLDAAGAVVATAAHGVETTRGTMSNLRTGQTELLEDTSGRARFARVRPGSLPGSAGYPTYGSTGGYRLDSACDATAPGAPVDVTVTTSFRQVTVSWQRPAVGHVTGYRVWIGERSEVLPAGRRWFQALGGGGIDQGQESVAIEALTGRTAGPSVQTSVTYPPRPSVSITGVDVDRQAGSATVTWQATISPQITDASWAVAGQGEDGYEEEHLPLGARTHTLGRLPASGRLDVEVCVRMPLRENSHFVVCDTRTATYPKLAPAPRVSMSIIDWHGTVDLSWPAVDGATGYQVSVDRAPWSGATSPARLLDLPEGLREFRVRAVTQAGPGAAAITRLNLSRGPTAPLDLTTSPGQDGTSLTVSWKRPADTGGLIGYRLHASDLGIDLALPAEQTSYTLTGLRPGSAFLLTLSARGRHVSSEPVSTWVQMPEQGAGAELPVPVLERVKSGRKGGPRSVVVAWSASSAEPVDGWEVTFTAVGDGRVKTFRLPGSVTDKDFRLPGSRAWRVRVRAVGPAGATGAWSLLSRPVKAR